MQKTCEKAVHVFGAFRVDGCPFCACVREFEVAKNKFIIGVVNIHRVYRLIRKVEHVTRMHGEGGTVVKLIGAAAREDVNERIAMSAGMLEQPMAVCVMPLDDCDYILYNERFF